MTNDLQGSFLDMYPGYIEELNACRTQPDEPWTAEDAKQWASEILEDEASTVIPVFDDARKMVGFLVISVWPQCHSQADYYINQSYVMPEYRNHGYMTRTFMEFLKKHPGVYCYFTIIGNKLGEAFWDKLFNIKADYYYTVLPPEGEPSAEEIQHAWIPQLVHYDDYDTEE